MIISRRVAAVAMVAVAAACLLLGRSTIGQARAGDRGVLVACAQQDGGAAVAQDSLSNARMVEIPELKAASSALMKARQLRVAGHFAEALEWAKRSEELGRAPAWVGGYTFATVLQGRILLDMGRYREALPLLTYREGLLSTSDPLEAEIALCRLKLGDTQGARAYDVQSVLVSRYSDNALVGLPGDATPTKLEASLWLARCCGNEGAFLKSEWAIRAARLAPRCVAANLHAARSLRALGQRRSAKPYYERAANASRCRMQEEAFREIRDHTADYWKDRYRQGTIPPPPGEGVEPMPDP